MFFDLPQWFVRADATDFGFLVAGLSLLTADGLYAFLRYSRLLRLIADTPTAPIRSAFQGFVQLEGTADWLPGPEIVAPLTGLPCVWYRYRIEERRGGRNRRRVVVDHEPDAIHVVRRGERGTHRLLVISTLSESQLLFRQRLRAYGSGLVFIVAASLFLWAVTARF